MADSRSAPSPGLRGQRLSAALIRQDQLPGGVCPSGVASSRDRLLLALLPTATAAVHHRCIMRAAFDTRVRHGEKETAWLSQVTQFWRRMRLTGPLQKSPALRGFSMIAACRASPAHHGESVRSVQPRPVFAVAGRFRTDRTPRGSSGIVFAARAGATGCARRSGLRKDQPAYSGKPRRPLVAAVSPCVARRRRLGPSQWS